MQRVLDYEVAPADRIPWIGKLSDNSTSRFGCRRPFILWGGLAMALTWSFLRRHPRELKKREVENS